jgi:hypothetical protein
MEATLLNPVQLHLLRMFSHNKDEASLIELKDVFVQPLLPKSERRGKTYLGGKKLE